MNADKNGTENAGQTAQGGTELNTLLKRSRKALEGKYRQEISELLGLSDIEIQMTGGLDRDVHEILISVVMEASHLGIPEDVLKSRIKKHGEGAVRIAKLVPSLARLFS